MNGPSAGNTPGSLSEAPLVRAGPMAGEQRDAGKPSVLLTGGGGAGNEAVYRLLHGRYDLHFADADAAHISPAVPPDRRHQITMANDPAFPTSIRDLCARLGIDLVVPAVDEELPLVHDLFPLDSPHRLLAPRHDFVQSMLDKLRSMQALREVGVDAPRTTNDPSELTYPLLLKPRSGRGSRGVRVVRDEQEAQAHLLLSGQEMVAQELMVGDEYTVMVSADADGQIGAIVPVHVVEKRGVTLRGCTEHRQDIQDLCHRIHDAFPTPGTYNVQLIATPEGRLAPFEINPRVSTTFCLGVAAGVDPFGIYLNGAPSKPSPFEEGLCIQRSWHNAFHKKGVLVGPREA